MVRVLLLILLVWLIYMVIKRAFPSNSPNNTTTHTKTEQNSDPKKEQNIVQCATCGMHVLESESIKKNDSVICNNPNCDSNP